ncbi:unnamed protein product [Paramecium pentaurelia]|uniref:Tetratricopeptide repeat protein n=1 Tax=Paramecium pentaurelia TaxID=43138 RepID=A0A8S1YLY2_9CILI|nr:unnamed protein product [Paramecium pentaurelia]
MLKNNHNQGISNQFLKNWNIPFLCLSLLKDQKEAWIKRGVYIFYSIVQKFAFSFILKQYLFFFNQDNINQSVNEYILDIKCLKNGFRKLKCQQDDHKDEIETVCYNQYCTEFRLNCFKCLKKSRIHHDHFDEIEKINTLMDFIERKNLECDNLINDLNTYVESLNKPFSLLKMGIRYKYSFQKERLVNLDSLQINDYLNSTIKFFEQKQSITTIISEQIKKLTNSLNNLYQQLQLSQFNYCYIDDNSIKLSKDLYHKGYDLYLGDKYVEAIQLLDESIQYNPYNHESLWCKGEIIVNQQINAYQLIIKLNIRNLNKYEDAINWLDKALAYNPKHVNSLSLKGRLNNNDINRECLLTYHELNQNKITKKYNESLQLLDQALSINPQHIFSLQSKGDCLKEINNNLKKLQFIMRNHQRLILIVNIQKTKRNFAQRN